MGLGLLDLGLGQPADALERLLVRSRMCVPNPIRYSCWGCPTRLRPRFALEPTRQVADHLDRFKNAGATLPDTRTPRTARPLPRAGRRVRCRPALPRAVELCDALSPFDSARSELLYGEWLRRHRRRIDARLHLRAALEIFQQLATTPWEARARSELRASGETARKRDPSTRDQLTPQELQISRLVASGKSNPEVAAQLFLSPRTIDYHLRKVFTKLEIASRAELADVGPRRARSRLTGDSPGDLADATGTDGWHRRRPGDRRSPTTLGPGVRP